jgi:hypothetical protein
VFIINLTTVKILNIKKLTDCAQAKFVGSVIKFRIVTMFVIFD